MHALGIPVLSDRDRFVIYYLDVPYEHCHENQSAGDGDDVEYDLQPLRRALQIPKGAEQRQRRQQ